jgi:ABC-2 type transport system permease protein
MMRILGQILKKELLQLLRTPALVGILLACPVITIGLVPFGLGNDSRLKVEVVDASFSDRGRALVARLDASPHIRCDQAVSLAEAERSIEQGRIDAIVVIPTTGEDYSILARADHMIVGMDAAYYIGRQLQEAAEQGSAALPLRIHSKYVSGSDNTHYYLVTMLVLLIAILGCFLAALSVINEKESKVLEHLRSTGMSPGLYVCSKLLFFTLVGLVELGVGLLIARTVFHLTPAGPLADYFLLAACFLLAIVSLGILVAACSRTMLQAIYIIVFLFFILVLLSTMFAPLDNMSPGWAATRYVNPFFWAVDGSWKIVLKGMRMGEIPLHYLVLLLTGGVLSGLSILRIRRIN